MERSSSGPAIVYQNLGRPAVHWAVRQVGVVQSAGIADLGHGVILDEH